MNRRDLLKRAFVIGAAGLMLPVIEPVRKVWALDRTMVPSESSWISSSWTGEWFHAGMTPMKNNPLTEADLIAAIEDVWKLVGTPPKYYYSNVVIDKPELLEVGAIYRIGDERVILESFNTSTGFMRASPV